MSTNISLIIIWRWKTESTSSWTFSWILLLLEFPSLENSLGSVLTHGKTYLTLIERVESSGIQIERAFGNLFLPSSFLFSFSLSSYLLFTFPPSLPPFYSILFYSSPAHSSLPSLPPSLSSSPLLLSHSLPSPSFPISPSYTFRNTHTHP